jgi:hypothetical protein
MHGMGAFLAKRGIVNASQLPSTGNATQRLQRLWKAFYGPHPPAFPDLSAAEAEQEWAWIVKRVSNARHRFGLQALQVLREIVPQLPEQLVHVQRTAEQQHAFVQEQRRHRLPSAAEVLARLREHQGASQWNEMQVAYALLAFERAKDGYTMDTLKKTPGGTVRDAFSTKAGREEMETRMLALVRDEQQPASPVNKHVFVAWHSTVSTQVHAYAPVPHVNKVVVLCLVVLHLF